ncbi:MAG: metallophosphoesterase family protein [Lachnospiraceae bacterium]|nr:metallophosphoesterase family protein [Lachnospiraceae bacterium]
MKVLIVADEVSKKYYDYYEPGMLKDIDLIISAGDLPPQYLEFLTTMSCCDVLYVHGNHDGIYDTRPPEGCICVDGCVYNHKGLRILGLGGSQRYKLGTHMYSEKEMRARVRKLKFQLFRNKGFDILLTHAPIEGHHDGEDLPHKGFAVFGELIEKYHPKYMIHGHQHKNYGKAYQQESWYKDTLVINAYVSYILEIPDELLQKRR